MHQDSESTASTSRSCRRCRMCLPQPPGLNRVPGARSSPGESLALLLPATPSTLQPTPTNLFSHASCSRLCSSSKYSGGAFFRSSMFIPSGPGAVPFLKLIRISLISSLVGASMRTLPSSSGTKSSPSATDSYRASSHLNWLI